MTSIAVLSFTILSLIAYSSILEVARFEVDISDVSPSTVLGGSSGDKSEYQDTPSRQCAYEVPHVHVDDHVFVALDYFPLQLIAEDGSSQQFVSRIFLKHDLLHNMFEDLCGLEPSNFCNVKES